MADDASPYGGGAMGEIGRVLLRIEATLKEYVLSAVYEVEKAAMSDRIKEIEEREQFRNRAIAALVVTSIIGPLITLKLGVSK